MMKILIVEPLAHRRAELVDWTCELPVIVIVDAVAWRAEAETVLARTRVDVIVVGCVTRASAAYTCAIVEASGTLEDLAAALAAHRASRIESATRAVHTMRLQHEGEARHANVQTLQFRLRTEARSVTTETIDLHSWLPLAIARLRAVVPDHVALVPMVAIDTLPVQCVANILEQNVTESVLRACERLPWGGTVWLTAAPGGDGEVVLDVLEDGRGEIQSHLLGSCETKRLAPAKSFR
jgi:hypothetical protein